MIYFIIKTLITALIVAITSEVARRYPSVSGIILVMPLTCTLTFIWIYLEAGDAQKVIQASYDILYLALPSLIFFMVLPILLKNNVNFYFSLFVSFLATLIGVKAFLYFKN
jgi:hypothetical protein